MKVVHLVEGHNFHVDWHYKFRVEKLEKLVAKAGSTIQPIRLTFKVGNCVIQNLWRKTPYSLFESCRG
jgi:hypothetical protein